MIRYIHHGAIKTIALQCYRRPKAFGILRDRGEQGHKRQVLIFGVLFSSRKRNDDTGGLSFCNLPFPFRCIFLLIAAIINKSDNALPKEQYAGNDEHQASI